MKTVLRIKDPDPGMSCWYLVTGLVHPYISRLDTRPLRSGEINPLILTIDPNFHGHPSKNQPGSQHWWFGELSKVNHRCKPT